MIIPDKESPIRNHKAAFVRVMAFQISYPDPRRDFKAVPGNSDVLSHLKLIGIARAARNFPRRFKSPEREKWGAFKYKLGIRARVSLYVSLLSFIPFPPSPPTPGLNPRLSFRAFYIYSAPPPRKIKYPPAPTFCPRGSESSVT